MVESLNERCSNREKEIRYIKEQIEESKMREIKLIAKNQKIEELVKLKQKSAMMKKQRKSIIDAPYYISSSQQSQGSRQEGVKSQESHQQTDHSSIIHCAPHHPPSMLKLNSSGRPEDSNHSGSSAMRLLRRISIVPFPSVTDEDNDCFGLPSAAPQLSPSSSSFSRESSSSSCSLSSSPYISTDDNDRDNEDDDNNENDNEDHHTHEDSVFANDKADNIDSNNIGFSSSSFSCRIVPHKQKPKLLIDNGRNDSIDDSTNDHHHCIQQLKSKIQSREREIRSLEYSIQENMKLIQHLHLQVQVKCGKKSNASTIR